MTRDIFNQIVDEILDEIRETLVIKGKEYSREENPFHNFEKGSARSGLIREKVLDGFLLKHEISISDMTNDLEEGKLPSLGAVREKFNDNIIYLILKQVMFIDRIHKSNES